MPVDTFERADELLRDDAERLRHAHPDLVEQLREYEDDWRDFQELLGRTIDEAERDAVAGRTRRASYRT